MRVVWAGKEVLPAQVAGGILVSTSGVARQLIQPVCVYHPLAKYAMNRSFPLEWFEGTE